MFSLRVWTVAGGLSQQSAEAGSSPGLGGAELGRKAVPTTLLKRGTGSSLADVGRAAVRVELRLGFGSGISLFP